MAPERGVQESSKVFWLMGNLTTYLQRQFIEHCPAGWQCYAEQDVLSGDLADLLAFQARADVLLSKNDGSRRLWIEFEVSRADPVANHAKFGTAHIFQPKPHSDVFISMVSSHVTRGRHNLAAASIFMLREIGINAFQTLLFPMKPAEEIKALNHRTVPQLLADETLSAQPELERAIVVSSPIDSLNEHRIFFASNVLEVMLNLREWNVELQTAEGKAQWGKRTVTFFVFDPNTGQFAPSKYCAFIPVRISDASGATKDPLPLMMDTHTYAALDETETRFDGAIARRHLCHQLSFKEQSIDSVSTEIRKAFDNWASTHSQSIRIHPRGAVILRPALWWM